MNERKSAGKVTLIAGGALWPDVDPTKCASNEGAISMKVRPWIV